MLKDLLNEADLYFKNKNYTAAESQYTAIIDKYWNNCDDKFIKEVVCKALNNRGQIKYLRVDFNEAIEDYSKALQLNDMSEVVLYNRGLIHYRLGRYVEAITDFNASLEVKPDFKDSIDALKVAQQEQIAKKSNDR